MRSFRLVIYFLCILAGNAFAQGIWESINAPNGNNLADVHFITAETGWAVGQTGTIIKTTDGGTTWSLGKSGTMADLSKVFFLDANTGWAVGKGGTLIKTIDGGSAWSELVGANLPGLNLADVFFIDAATGWIVGAGGTIYKTIDGGASWSAQISGTTNDLTGVQFVSGATGWVVGANGTILKTSTGGATWISQTSPTTEALSSLKFVDADTGWAVGGGRILRTTDGGSTWVSSSISENGLNYSVDLIDFVNSHQGWALVSRRILFTTTDGGISWTELSWPPFDNYDYFSCFAFIDPQSGWMVGERGIIAKTSDGGKTWTSQTGLTDTFTRIQFLDQNKGWVLGTYHLFGTTNGGTNWTLLSVPPSGYGYYYTDVHFYDGSNGWLLSHMGLRPFGQRIDRTIDGGQTWTQKYGNYPPFLSDIFFVTPDIGWVLGDAGWIAKTVNGGDTWPLQTSGTSANLKRAYFVDVQTGWVVGQNGLILKTADGGTTWSPQASGTTQGLGDIQFKDSQLGWATGGNGTILKTTDGGSTWLQKPSGSTSGLGSVFFMDALTGWAVGAGGTILKSVDGGETWSSQSSGTTNELYGICFTSQNSGWAVGGGGTWLKFRSDGPPALRLISPNGGETWGRGVPAVLSWTSAGLNGSVTAELFEGGRFVRTIGTAPAASGTLTWDVPRDLPSGNDYKLRLFQGATEDCSDYNFSVGPAKWIHLNRSRLTFGVAAGSVATQTQSVLVGNSGEGTLNWTAAANASLDLSPTSGRSGTVLLIGLQNANSFTPGRYEYEVTVADPAAWNSPQVIKVDVIVSQQWETGWPFGEFATPTDGTTGITGAIPITGWVLDDIEATKVEIWRDPVVGEGSTQIFIGNGIFVEGARPDVEQAYPDYPFNYRAGWGYMLLTNFLPNLGNGTYKLYAFATDKEGNQVLLGSKTITCSNATAVKPFGTIDTPMQGGDASGNLFVNFGWVLTPKPKTVSKDGSAIDVYVDSVKVGNLATAPNVYNQYRVDVATAFPGLNNSSGPVGAFYLDTTKYANGVHTIYWVATDDQGAADGIGSRYFQIVNTGTSAEKQLEESFRIWRGISSASAPLEDVLNLPLAFDPIGTKRGFDPAAPSEKIVPDNFGWMRLSMNEVERIEFDLGQGTFYLGYQIVGDDLRPLPIGSTLDAKTGTFNWLPGPGFLGSYDLVFVGKNAFGVFQAIRVRVTIRPKFFGPFK